MTYITNRRCVRGRHNDCPGYTRMGWFGSHTVSCHCECHDRLIDTTPEYDIKAWSAGRRHGEDMPLGCVWLDGGGPCDEPGRWDLMTKYGNTGRSKAAPYCDIHIDQAIDQVIVRVNRD